MALRDIQQRADILVLESLKSTWGQKTMGWAGAKARKGRERGCMSRLGWGAAEEDRDGEDLGPGVGVSVLQSRAARGTTRSAYEAR